MSVLHKLKESLREHAPAVWRAMHCARYSERDDAPDLVSATLAGTLAAWSEGASRDTSTTVAAITAAQLARYDVPTWWASREMLLAVDRTQLPAGIEWPSIHMPYPAGVIIFPPGLVRSSTGRAYRHVTWCRTTAGEPIPIPASGGRATTTTNDAMIFTSVDPADPMLHVLTLSLDATASPSAELPEELPPVDSIQMDGDEESTMRRLARLALGIILVCHARPEMVEPGEKLNGGSRRSGVPPEWSPTRIGRRYVGRRETPGGTHASPRSHWRRGHLRQQAHGPEMGLRKTIWIEPVWVG